MPAQAAPAGCYDRSYSAAHLTANPQQHVARIRLWLDPRGGEAQLSVWTAMQGHVLARGLGNRRFDSGLVCWSEGGRDLCGIECDGGVARLTASGDTLDFRTDRMWVGEGDDCGGPVDLAEIPDTPVTYRMTRVADAVCRD